MSQDNTTTQTTDQGQQIQVMLDEREMKTVYANAYRIHTAPEEVVIDLGFNMPNPNHAARPAEPADAVQGHRSRDHELYQRQAPRHVAAAARSSATSSSSAKSRPSPARASNSAITQNAEGPRSKRFAGLLLRL